MMRSLVLLILGLFLLASSSCATLREAGAECEREASHQIGLVFGNYEQYRDGGLRSGLVADTRSSLEQARTILFAEARRSNSGAGGCPKSQQRRPSWRELSEDFETAEILVRELEQSRGVRFVEVRGSNPVWVDQTTGKEVPPEMALSI